MVHTYQLIRDDTPVHTSNDSVLFWRQETTASGETVYTCVANNTVATANATKAITVNGNLLLNYYCFIPITLHPYVLKFKEIFKGTYDYHKCL